MDDQELLEFVTNVWDKDIVPTLHDYIRIPNVSPVFEEDWAELGASSPKDAVERIVSFHRRVADGRDVLLVAYNSHFDAAFLDHLFRAQGRTWRELYHYFILDLPSMAWSLGLRHLDGSALTEALGIEDEPHVAAEHTGLTGADVNVRIYRALRERRNNR